MLLRAYVIEMLLNCLSIVAGPDGRIKSVGGSGEGLIGVAPREMIGFALESFYLPEDRSLIRSFFQGSPPRMHAHHSPKAAKQSLLGKQQYTSDNIFSCGAGAGQEVYCFWSWETDDPAGKVSAQRSGLSNPAAGRWDAAPFQAIWAWDFKGGIVEENPSFTRLFGARSDASISSWMKSIHPEDRCLLLREICQLVVGRAVRVQVDFRLMIEQRERWISTDIGIWQGAIAGNATDSTERYCLINCLKHQSTHDTLTGLSNREGVYIRLDQLRTRDDFAVAFLDLDRFKRVNDAFGHHIGDELLIQVARRLEASPCLDMVGRYGGDEFVLLLSGVRDVGEAEAKLAEVFAELKQPYWVRGRKFDVGFCAGLRMALPWHSNPRHYVRDADMAMYSAKLSGSDSLSIFEPALQRRASTEMDLESRLFLAIESDALHMNYQPIINLRRSAVVCYEALARWLDPVLGSVSPARFVHVAERSGLIQSLGKWALKRVVADMDRMRGVASLNPLIAVNISPHQFRRVDFLSSIEQLIEDLGVGPERLEFEITESVAMSDIAKSTEKMNHLRAMGIRLAIDDFGTGYSSLFYLKNLPVSVLKIDKAFISDLAQSVESVAIVRAIVALSRSLGLQVRAEGVETRDQMSILTEIGVDDVQGYWIGRPMHPGDIDELAILEGVTR